VIAARRSSAVVLDRVNRALQSMVADGTLAALLDRWL
jgi:ABC-type amino acid transport substrate-binding protein